MKEMFNICIKAYDEKKNINGYCFSLCKINDLVSIGTSIGKILMYKIKSSNIDFEKILCNV